MVGDILLKAVGWLLIAFFGGQAVIFISLILWTIWNDAIKPRLIPAADIDRVADDIIANYPDPELEAFTRHERAWYDSDGAEQTYWNRVRKAVRRRLQDKRT
ncbi:hypothetical protein C7441_110195 [Pseudaminobacter salicylatoxidans]|uniref:Uncharacterized protein n=1 Tax=Pseudaminobacter salicylatoxidans TaxID=93369 RepID=A0A316C5M4_PSESE|nr:hypothetical protein [Pseudaminobacter salicylatoxidans]PWJ81658.1 hypothetical protein C7441_110195 [Pseudaminobacter salicylatoxidans]